jgi:hypothetical protein
VYRLWLQCAPSSAGTPLLSLCHNVQASPRHSTCMCVCHGPPLIDLTVVANVYRCARYLLVAWQRRFAHRRTSYTASRPLTDLLQHVPACI